MTRVELIRLIGDVLRQLDNLKTTRPGDASLTEVRNALARQQLKIAITDLDEGTPAFLKAIEDILAANAELRGAIESTGRGNALVEKLKYFAKACNALVGSRS